MRRWDQVLAQAARTPDPHAEVVVAGVRAAVIAPESEVRGWFSLPVPAGTVDGLVRAGRLTRPATGWLAIPV
jgi:hypothetical protein